MGMGVNVCAGDGDVVRTGCVVEAGAREGKDGGDGGER